MTRHPLHVGEIYVTTEVAQRLQLVHRTVNANRYSVETVEDAAG